MWDIEFYETADGRCPTQEFLDSLNKSNELPFAIRKLDRLAELGSGLRRPHADILKDHIYELRIPIRHKEFRLLYFFFFDEKIIISHGIHKYSKVPQAEIEKAKRHREDYLIKHGRRK